MPISLHPRPVARPAHTEGPTFATYTPNGRKLITVGSDTTIRIFQTGSDAEPTNIDDCAENNAAVVASNDFFITGSEDGTVRKYSLETNALDEILYRCTLPIRDLALSPDGEWVAIASDELAVKVVNTEDMTRVKHLREQTRSVKHVSWDPSSTLLTVSSSDGIVFVYSLSSEEPQLVKKVDGLIRTLDTEAEASSKVIWHPDGRAFAAPTATRDIQVMSKGDWEKQKAFKTGHGGDVSAAAWSPNGALLVSAGLDRRLVLWDTKTQTVVKSMDDNRTSVCSVTWHPTDNLLSYTNLDGELFIHKDFVPAEQAALLEQELQRAPFLHDPLAEVSGNARPALTNGAKNGIPTRRRQGTPDSLDDILGPEEDEAMSDVGGFIVDDDGAGYAEEVNGHGKRTNGHLELDNYRDPKRSRGGYSTFQPQVHPPFQPGSTPWRGNRRYLCLNLTGIVWTVDQETHHTVTVEFYDREFRRDFHFTDPFLYDKACLADHGALFSCPRTENQPAMLYYRPHETWVTRTDWRVPLPPGEDITSIALSESYIVATTSTNYIRVYTLFGTPFRIYRAKSSPAVTCAAWRDYVLTIGNGAVDATGRCQLLYSIENVKRDETCQSADIVALPAAEVGLQSVFFSDKGDPCIYDTSGTLLVLQHWRTPGQARWIPLLDTKLLARQLSGRKEESYWPVAVAQEKFHCIILKGGDRYPYFPRPLLTDFEFHIPVSLPAQGEEEDAEVPRLEESFVRNSIMLSLLEDLLGSTHATRAQKEELSTKELEIDKTLLQLLAAECREGEERGMKALELVGLFKDKSGRMIEAAGKVAARFGRDVLGEKIREVGERMFVGLDVEEY